MNAPIVIFTDLDGTLLSQHDYDFAPATPCLDIIRQRDIPLVFTSSKTAVEIERLCTQTSLYHPYVAENGGLLAIPKSYFSSDTTIETYEKELIGISRRDIKTALKNLSALFKFKAFSEMQYSEIVELTGFDERQARHANTRKCSESIRWQDSEGRLKTFSRHLEDYNLQLLRGEQFYQVTGNYGKAAAMVRLLKKYRKHYGKDVVSIALGDSPNDLGMLKAADYGVVIPNPGISKKHFMHHTHLIHAPHPGPRGWNATLIKLLEELAE